MKKRQIIIKTITMGSIMVVLLPSAVFAVGVTRESQINETTQIPSQKQQLEKSIIFSGMFGTSSFSLDSEGVLTFEAGNFGPIGVVPWVQYTDQIKKIVFNGKVIANPQSTGLFGSLPQLREIENLSNLDTSNVETMSLMFRDCTSLTSLDLSSFDTSNVHTMDGMFSGCSSLTSLNLSNFDTSNVWRMDYMFSGCSSLKQLTLGNKFSFSNGLEASLPSIQITNLYTGKWQNIGTGNATSPNGTNIWTSDELMSNYVGSKDAGTYIWQTPAVKGGDVTTKYVDTEGNKIADDVVTSGNVGEGYSTEQKAIDGYTFKEVQGNPTGQFTDQPQTVTYVYEQTKDQSTVIVHDSELTVGDTWSPEDNFDNATDYYGNTVPFSGIFVEGSVDTSKVGTYKVTYSRKKIPTFFSASENQGTDSAVATITVKEAQPVKGGDVTVKYVDTEGDKISDDVVKSGNVAEDYSTEQKDIDGYTFKEVKGSPTGKFTDQPQTITYVYTKNEIPNVTGTILVKYVDTDGNKISEDIVKSGTVGEGYSTEQKDIDGYTFKEVQGNTTGQFTEQVQTVTYVYTKDKNDTANPGLKPENRPGSKDKNNNQGITSSEQHGLPATGENERMTMMSIILGLVLLTVGVIISIFRFKKVNK